MTTINPQSRARKSAPADIGSHRILVTFFKNEFAKSLTTENLTLLEMQNLVLQTKGSTKTKLPWWKLAGFGNKKSPPDPETGKGGGCLRWDPNVDKFSGIEADYDGEVMSFDEAVAILKEMNVRALIYTSPSHTEAAPRWRLLLPVSCELPLEMRAKLVARVNGRFGGIFASESFTLSQSYYFGAAKDNPAPDHRAESSTAGWSIFVMICTNSRRMGSRATRRAIERAVSLIIFRSTPENSAIVTTMTRLAVLMSMSRGSVTVKALAVSTTR